MWRQILMGVIGFSGGVVAAGGMVALLIGLGIIPRFAGITRTGDKILLYEDVTMLGAVAGCVVQVYSLPIPLGEVGVMAYGLFAGVFLGGWILALAEMVDVFPILIRRVKLQQGLPYMIITIAVAKTLGSLFFFYKGW